MFYLLLVKGFSFFSVFFVLFFVVNSLLFKVSFCHQQRTEDRKQTTNTFVLYEGYILFYFSFVSISVCVLFLSEFIKIEDKVFCLCVEMFYNLICPLVKNLSENRTFNYIFLCVVSAFTHTFFFDATEVGMELFYSTFGLFFVLI